MYYYHLRQMLLMEKENLTEGQVPFFSKGGGVMSIVVQGPMCLRRCNVARACERARGL